MGRALAKPITFLTALSIIMTILGLIACPIRRIVTEFHMTMKRGRRPVAHPRNETVLDRIDMDIIKMPGKIAFIPDCVLPIAPLPDAAFALGRAT